MRSFAPTLLHGDSGHLRWPVVVCGLHGSEAVTHRLVVCFVVVALFVCVSFAELKSLVSCVVDEVLCFSAGFGSHGESTFCFTRSVLPLALERSVLKLEAQRRSTPDTTGLTNATRKLCRKAFFANRLLRDDVSDSCRSKVSVRPVLSGGSSVDPAPLVVPRGCSQSWRG